jgi:hypothetical protein
VNSTPQFDFVTSERAVAAGQHVVSPRAGEVHDGAHVRAPLRLAERAAARAERIRDVEVLRPGCAARADAVAELPRRQREADEAHEGVPRERSHLVLELLSREGVEQAGDGAVDTRVVALVAGAAAAGEDVHLPALEAAAERRAQEADGAGLRAVLVRRVPVLVRVGVERAGHGRPALEEDAGLHVEEVDAVEVAARLEGGAAA